MGFTKLIDHSTMNFFFCNLLGGCPGKIMKMSECFEKHNAHQTADIKGSKLFLKPVLAGYQKQE